jgi:hypothetical protein
VFPIYHKTPELSKEFRKRIRKEAQLFNNPPSDKEREKERKLKGLEKLLNIFVFFCRLHERLMGFWEKYILNYGTAVQRGHKSNAYAPLVWFDVFTLPILSLLICIIKIPFVEIALSVLLILVVLFSLVMYLMLYLKDPKLLQSEYYRLEDKKLDMIAQKGGDILVEPVGLTQIGNEPHE